CDYHMRSIMNSHPLVLRQPTSIPIERGYLVPWVPAIKYVAFFRRMSMFFGQNSHHFFFWAELTPFFLMSKQEAVEALIEYVLWQEQPSAAKGPWLAMKINEALFSAPSTDDNSCRSFAPIAFINNVRWCKLLHPGTKSMLLSEAKKYFPSESIFKK